MQFSTDELVKEVENSVTEFKKHKQEYDEERVKDQVSTLLNLSIYHFPFNYKITERERGSC